MRTPHSRDCQAYAPKADVGPPSLSTRCCRFQDGPLRQDSRLYEAPERDQELTSEGDNPQLAQPGTARPKSALIPLRQSTRRLEASPGPGDLNGHRPDMPIACFGDPEFTARLATLIRGWGQAS